MPCLGFGSKNRTKHSKSVRCMTPPTSARSKLVEAPEEPSTNLPSKVDGMAMTAMPTLEDASPTSNTTTTSSDRLQPVSEPPEPVAPSESRYRLEIQKIFAQPSVENPEEDESKRKMQSIQDQFGGASPRSPRSPRSPAVSPQVSLEQALGGSSPVPRLLIPTSNPMDGSIGSPRTPSSARFRVKVKEMDENGRPIVELAA